MRKILGQAVVLVLLLTWLGYAQCPMCGWWGGPWGGPWGFWGFFGWILGFVFMILLLGLLLLLFLWLYRRIFSPKLHN